MSIRVWAGLVLATAVSLPSAVLAQQREVTGRVVGETGAGIPGAAVTVSGTRTTVVTDQNGNFRVTVPSSAVVLIAHSIGYRRSEVSVPADMRTVTITMPTDVLGLDELVVTGRATSVSRRNLANAVATVSAADLERAPAQTLEKALQGKIAGANIETNSGAPGGGAQVRLRGVSTINAQPDPLYVVDGVIISNAEIPSNANAVTRAAGGSNPSLKQDAVVNRIADITPADIETIEVLKGPSAAAIYGSKAANGVVIITTRRGRPGAARVTLSQRFGQYRLSNKLGFRTFETVDEAVSAYGDGARAFFGPSGAPLQTFDHEELLAGRTDLSTETVLSIGGGSDATQYFVSATWKDDRSIIANTGFEKQGLRVNLDQRFGERLHLGVGTNLLHSVAARGLTNNDNSGTSFYMVFPFTPNFVDLRRQPDGTWARNPFERSNPLETAALMKNDEDVWRLTASSNATFDAYSSGSHSLQLIATGGIDYFAQKNDLFFPPELQFEPLDGQPGTKLLSNSDNLRYNVSGNLVYTLAPAAGSYRAVTSFGVQYEDDDLNIARVASRGLIAGMPNIDAGTTVEVRQQRARVKDVGLYVQEELLALDDRLLLSAGLRADRSSANGDPDKYFLFPKAAASYRLPGFTEGVDELKLRVAVGQSGNRPLFGQKFTPLSGTRNIEGLPGLLVVGVAGDPAIEPERQTEVEGGFDAILFGDRATLTVTGFNKTITNLLLQRQMAPSTGFVQQIFNGGKMRVRGLELALDAIPFRQGRASWISRTTFYGDRSRILELPVPAFRTGGFGTALGAYEIAEGESATQIVANVLEGDSVVVRKVGNGMPDFRMGFSNDIAYGQFMLSSLVDWQHGGNVINLTKLLFDFGQNTADYDSDPQFVENIGPVVVQETLTLGERRIRGFGMETRPYIEDASYVKLRELSLSYQVPASLLSRLGSRIESGRITLSGRNLLTFTDYTGLDPEVSNFGNQPIARNIDVAPFPPSRSFWLSLEVAF
ncbi:MAG TPA: SusC/RagA family TonB-linked outer membrane protein [Longimicrobiales bacterium]